MKTILDKCGGLPLAIVNIASLLSSYNSANSRDMWERVCKSIGSQMESNPTLEGMRQIITLSYNHMPHHLKGCMMYLSSFPEDYVIDKTRLLYRWIAEGLITKKRGLTLLEVAEAYFDELISRNMILPANISYDGRVQACQVHDMMLEVMVSKSQEANFLTLLGGQSKGTSYDKIRRLSIHRDDRSPTVVKQGSKRERVAEVQRTRHGVEAMNLEHVRSLSMFQPQGHKLLDRLDKFPLLRVLDLEDCKAVEDRHMDIICRLFLLKFLSLQGTDITKVPSEIGDLEHLQILNVYNTHLTGLPDTVTSLEKLECLYISNKNKWDAVWRLPRGLKKMKALGMLDKVDLNDAQVAQEIGELSQLRELCIILTCSDDDSVLQELASALGRTYSLRWLSIVDHGGTKKLNFLLQLPSPPLLLRYLRISGMVDKLPDWIKSLTHLTQINFSATKLRIDQLLGVLCELPSLVDMVLWRYSYTDNELVARPEYRFPMLKKLSVVSDCDEHKVLKFEEGSMQMLEKLEYRFDNWEKRIIGIKNLKSLKEVILIGNMHNPALIRTVEKFKTENNSRAEGMQFNVTVRKD
uniref:NB-ARC domain-containing protein n=1 Tax=Arundo donax TaxID=35708 RepID=A0A0A9D4I2_ARUDO